VWFIGADGQHSVKDIRSGDQIAADPDRWNPPADDLRPAVISSDSSQGAQT
jgi:histidyl-tRNA synthetase